eukprot:1980962-Prymnesium_polylepis.1
MAAQHGTRVFLLDTQHPGQHVGHVLLCPPDEAFEDLVERVGSLLGEYTSRLFVRSQGGHFEITSVDMLRRDDVIVTQLGAMSAAGGDDGPGSGGAGIDAPSGPMTVADIGPVVPMSSRASTPLEEEDDELQLEARELLARMQAVEAAASGQSAMFGADDDTTSDDDDDDDGGDDDDDDDEFDVSGGIGDGVVRKSAVRFMQEEVVAAADGDGAQDEVAGLGSRRLSLDAQLDDGAAVVTRDGPSMSLDEALSCWSTHGSMRRLPNPEVLAAGGSTGPP